MALLGIGLPFRKGTTGFPETASEDTLIEESLRSIILTPVGQRVMRPRFGCNAMSYVFENNNVLLRAKIKQETFRAIQHNEPRVRVTAVRVTPEDTKVVIVVQYIVNRMPGQTTVDLPKAGV